MKGPYERLKYDLRRVWKCPICGKHDRTSGMVTTRFCPCQKNAPASERRCMQLIHHEQPQAKSTEG